MRLDARLAWHLVRMLRVNLSLLRPGSPALLSEALCCSILVCCDGLLSPQVAGREEIPSPAIPEDMEGAQMQARAKLVRPGARVN